MKIGILTFINTTNYGASLQAYALQETLKKKGYEVEVIQYNNKHIRDKETNKINGFNLKELIKKILIGKKIEDKIKKFKEFESRNIKFSEEFTKLLDIEKKYDKIIVGSDQVWNLSLTDNDWNYFLEFVNDNKKKIAYAPSFGNVEFDEKYIEKAKKLLSDFSALSIRENKGAAFIENKFGLKCKTVIDPTLLLSSSEWDKKISYCPPIKDYILVYFPNNKKKVFEFAKKLSKKEKLPIVYLSISPKKVFGVKTIYDASPEEFIGWIKNATYVITGSFHGTVFSLNYNKNFFFENTGNGSRIDNIVELTNTKSRNIDNLDFKDIDYEYVEKKLEFLRKDSEEWLGAAINEDGR